MTEMGLTKGAFLCTAALPASGGPVCAPRHPDAGADVEASAGGGAHHPEELPAERPLPAPRL